MLRALLFSAVCVLHLQAQSLTTLPPNNGTGGIFLQLTPSGPGLTFTGFSTYFASTAGTPVTLEVWVRDGAYAGFTASNTGWTLSQTLSGFSAGTAVESPLIALTTPINLASGSTTSIYLHGITGGGGIRYQGTGTTSTGTFSNADLTLFSDIARTGAVAFAGTQNTPRAFSGTIFYTPAIPEPGTYALLATAAAGWVVWRRRKS